MTDFYATRPQPLDQADGLRRLFTQPRRRHVAVVGNPHIAFGGVLLERLTAAFAASGRHTLVVDAADRSPPAHELSWLDLAACIEPLSSDVSYLAARGLPLRHVDTRGSSAGLLQALADAAPRADVVLLHANAGDLARLFAHRHMRPVLLAGDSSDSVTDAYASLKLLVARHGVMGFDVMLATDPDAPRGAHIVRQLASCADRFLGAALHDHAVVDPACDSREAPSADLMRLAAALIDHDDEPTTPAQRQVVPSAPSAAQPAVHARLPARN